jgi:hypothetical protein
MHVDFTEAALNELLLRHMVPRFRALLRGAVVRDDNSGGSTKAT